MDIKTLCEQYSPYDYRERLVRLFREFDRVLVTSSFGTSSVILLHHLKEICPGHPIHFIDTRYHFEETYAYVEQLRQAWNLNVMAVQPRKNENLFTQFDYTWTYHPDRCCFVNKVMPLQNLKESHDVWISGMIGGTTDFRKNLPLFKADDTILRFYPFADMQAQEAEWYRLIHELPEHPLQAEGYGSVGCTHCTAKGEGREGRWAGKGKTECGLHTFGDRKQAG